MSSVTSTRQLQTFQRLSSRMAALATVVLAGTVGLVGSGVFGGWSGGSSASGTATAGTITLSSIGTGDTTLDTAVSNWIPGDIVQRVVKVTNGGTQAIKSFTIAGKIDSSVTGSPGTATAANFISNTTMTVDYCSGTTATFGSDTTYVCSGGTPWTQAVGALTIGSGSFGAGLTWTPASPLAAAGFYIFRVNITFSSAMDNTYQGRVPVYSVQFTGNQRSGTAK